MNRSAVGTIGLLAIAGALYAQEAAHEHPAGQEHDAAADMEMPAEETGPPQLPTVNDLIDVELHEDIRQIEVVIGPVSLPQNSGHLRVPIQMGELPVAGWMHGFEWEITDGDGNVLPERLLHHVNMLDPDNRELFSPVPRRIMAAGRETKRAAVPHLLGYPLAEGTRVLVTAMFASRPDASYDDTYLHIHLFYTPADDPGFISPRNVYPFYLDVMGPVGDKDFELPPGTHGRSWEGSPATGGRILGIGGHLHDYGDWLRLEDVTTGKILWETTPEHDAEGRVSGVPLGKLWWRGGVRIYPDHVYRVSVQYTNPLDAMAPDGAMGAFGGIILAHDARWPAFDREDEAYVQDLRNTLNRPNQAMNMHSHGDSGG